MESIEVNDYIEFNRAIYSDFWGTRVEKLHGTGQVTKLHSGRTKGFHTATVGHGTKKLKVVIDDAKITGKQTSLSIGGTEEVPSHIPSSSVGNSYDL